jgi:peptide/nickel transport system substrate-binding protein
MKYKIALLALALTLVVFSSIATAQQPGPASDKITIRRYTIADAVPAIRAGEIDAYMFALRPAQAVQLIGDPNVRLVTAPAGLIELTLNPAPVHVETIEGELTADQVLAYIKSKYGVTVPAKALVNLYYETVDETVYTIAEFGAFPGKGVNPLAFREIRLALNYVVDRDAFASVVMRGFAVPMYTFLSQYDPDIFTIADIVAKYEFKYDLNYAKGVVIDVMSAIGAALGADGYWYYEGKPITLTIIIRIEDERRDLGWTFNAELQKLGFNTNPVEMTFATAIETVYGTDPAEFQWHVYTAGWGKGGIEKYDSGTIAQFCAPWVGYMPGWGEPTWWNYRNPEIDELTQRIYTGNYSSKEERDELYRRATELCIRDSIRLWVVTRLDANPVRAEVKGVTLDLGAGLRGIWNLREMYREDRNYLNLGHLWAWTSSSVWNWWGGFTDVYSVDPARGTYDPSTWAHPFSGDYMAFRTPYVVETEGPTGKLQVPATAKKWDVENNVWVEVGEGVYATSMVVFDLSKMIGTKFHNGITITMADYVGYVALLYELVYDPAYSSLEPRISGNTKPWLDTIVAWEFDDENKLMTVYVNYWHFDEDYIGAWASIGFGNPLEIHVATFELALDRRSETGLCLYQTRVCPGISLVVPAHVARIRDTLVSYLNNETVLAKVQALTDNRVTMDEWNARINADLNWIDTYSLAWISYGPFMLTKLDTSAQLIELTAFRDSTYPFKKGDWYYGFPTYTEIVSVETPDKVYLGATAKINVTVSGIPPFAVKYVLKDPAGNVVATGLAEPVEVDKFTITLPSDLTSKFIPDQYYTLIVLAASETIATPAAVRVPLLTAAPEGAIVITITQTITKTLTMVTTTTTTTTTTKTTTETTTATETVTETVTETTTETTTATETVTETVTETTTTAIETTTVTVAETTITTTTTETTTVTTTVPTTVITTMTTTMTTTVPTTVTTTMTTTVPTTVTTTVTTTSPTTITTTKTETATTTVPTTVTTTETTPVPTTPAWLLYGVPGVAIVIIIILAALAARRK